MKCRFCESNISLKLIDLGFAPYSNAYLDKSKLNNFEKYYPLRVRVCENCWLVQSEWEADSTELFEDTYAYFSSTSNSWLAHASDYSKNIIKKLDLNTKSFVIEIASNDGYLLKNFVEEKIPCLGVEPTTGTAEVAKKNGVNSIQKFFSRTVAKEIVNEYGYADLVIGNNVYAHVPNINDFTSGLKLILNKSGVITLEFPHLLKLLEYNQFDTIYHEHFSYFSLHTVKKIFETHGLKIWNVEELITHGGSLRIYGCNKDANYAVNDSVNFILNKEKIFGLLRPDIYGNFQTKANVIKNNLVKFLIEQKNNNKCVVAYGAAAKGNTILNYAGIKKDLLPVVFDASTSKQGKYLPGSHIPIKNLNCIVNYNPEYILVLPWNILSEVKTQLAGVVPKSVKYLRAIPFVEVL